MVKVKLFYGTTIEDLENEINNWLIGKEMVQIESSLSTGQDNVDVVLVTVVYKG